MSLTVFWFFVFQTDGWEWFIPNIAQISRTNTSLYVILLFVDMTTATLAYPLRLLTFGNAHQRHWQKRANEKKWCSPPPNDGSAKCQQTWFSNRVGGKISSTKMVRNVWREDLCGRCAIEVVDGRNCNRLKATGRKKSSLKRAFRFSWTVYMSERLCSLILRNVIDCVVCLSVLRNMLLLRVFYNFVHLKWSFLNEILLTKTVFIYSVSAGSVSNARRRWKWWQPVCMVRYLQCRLAWTGAILSVQRYGQSDRYGGKWSAEGVV